MTNKNSKATKQTQKTVAQNGGKTYISGPVLDRLIKDKMARTPECDGVAAMPVVRKEGGAADWRVPGYVGEGARVARCEAAIRDYLEFLATQFDRSDD
jgi:hypothetical protein